ncbi:MAG: GNAT family N-acetyltransferase [Dehalococcoidales bacterium]|nr:MAG: GNAT family N-acetyltransferase [Dehalococcoidales bacterium]
MKSQKTMVKTQVEYRVSPPVTNQELNTLFASAWPDHNTWDFTPTLEMSLGYVCAFQGDRLVGFVNVAWDGGRHAFLLDTTVHSDIQRHGIGLELVRRAENLAREAGLEWLHVDYETHLSEFYEKCGFKNTTAGLIKLKD